MGSFGFNEQLLLPPERERLDIPGSLQAGMSLGDLIHRRQRESSLADIYRQSAADPSALASNLLRGGFGTEAYAAQDQQQQMLNQQAAAQKARAEALQKQAEAVGQVFWNVKDTPSLQAAKRALIQMGHPAEHVAALPDEYNEQSAPLIDGIRAYAVPAQERFKVDESTKAAEARRKFDAEQNELNRKNHTINASIVAGQKADERRTEDDRRIADERRKASVQGFEILPDASPSIDDAKKMKVAINSASKIRKYTAELRQLHKEHGTEATGPVAARMRQIETAIKIEGKNIAELGALSGPDTELMNSLTGADTTSFQANLKSVLGVDNTNAALDGLEKWVNTAVDSSAETFGYRKAAAQSGPTRRTGVSGVNLESPPSGVRMRSPSGETGTISPDEVADAEKNGWKRVK